MPAPIRSIRVFGVPIDLGQTLRGVDMGPSALRYAGLRRRLRALGHTVEDRGNVEVPVRDHLSADDQTVRNEAIVAVCHRLAEHAATAVAEGTVPVFLGGDHSIGAGTVAGIAAGRRTGVIWIDAHGDMNTMETSPSGNVHGMSLAALLGDGDDALTSIGGTNPSVRAEDVVLIGVRDLDPAERTRLRECGATVYSMREVDERGIAGVTREAFARLTEVEHLHVSLDLDSLDPGEAPGVGTPVHGGLTYREAQLLCEMLADSGLVGSLDVVEVNPILDERNRTAETAVELVESIFGKTIL